MSNSTVLHISIISQQVIIYVGFFLFIIGLIGNSLALIVFVSLRTFRESSCAFYLIIMSFVNIFHLFTGLLTFIMINGFEINWLNMSRFYCKFRPFYVQLCILTSFTCMSFATIDQFFSTCPRPQWQQLCNIKLARYIVIGIIICLSFHGIPHLLYYDHILSNITHKLNCVVTNITFQRYLNNFQIPILTSSLPISIMIIFGILSYRNVKQITYRTIPLVRRELDKQLTKMVLVQIFYDAIAVLPSTISTISNLIYYPNDSILVAQRNFISNLIITAYYFHFVGSFYIYVCVSKRFRQQLIYVLFTIHLNRFCIERTNKIEPQT